MLFTLHVDDRSNILGCSTEVQEADAPHLVKIPADGRALVWPKDQTDDGGRPSGLLQAGRFCVITHALDSARYYGSGWGRKYPPLRDDWHGYEGLELTATDGDIFRHLRAKFGRCVKRTATGWIFERTDKTYGEGNWAHFTTVVKITPVENPS